MRKTKTTKKKADSIPSDKADLILAEIHAMRTGYDKRFDGIDQRFETIDRRFDGIDERFDGVDEKLKEHDRQFISLEEHLEGNDTHFVSLEEHLAQHNRQIAAINTMLLDHKWRLQDMPTKEDYEANTRRILGAIESLTGHFERLDTESKISSAQIDRIGTHLKKHDEEIFALKTKVGLAS